MAFSRTLSLIAVMVSLAGAATAFGLSAADQHNTENTSAKLKTAHSDAQSCGGCCQTSHCKADEHKQPTRTCCQAAATGKTGCAECAAKHTTEASPLTVEAAEPQGHAFGRGRGPGFGRGRGFGPGRGRGAGHDDQFAADHDDFFFLLDHRDAIRRTVKNLPDGIETLTESDDAEVAAKIQEHVAAMYDRVENERPIHMRDPLFREIFANAKKIQMEMTETEHGILVKETSKDPYVARLLHEHGKVVSLFLKNGHAELPRNHPLPAREPAGAAK